MKNDIPSWEIEGTAHGRAFDATKRAIVYDWAMPQIVDNDNKPIMEEVERMFPENEFNDGQVADIVEAWTEGKLEAIGFMMGHPEAMGLGDA